MKPNTFQFFKFKIQMVEGLHLVSRKFFKNWAYLWNNNLGSVLQPSMSNIYPSPHGKHFELSNLVPPKNIYSQTSTPGQIVAEQANHCFQWMLSVIQEVSDQGLTQHYHHQESPDLILADRPSFSHVIIRSNQINLSLCLKTKSETWKRKKNRKCIILNRKIAHFLIITHIDTFV